MLNLAVRNTSKLVREKSKSDNVRLGRLFTKKDTARLMAGMLTLDPGKTVRSMTEKGRGAVFFSATLSPMEYYKSLLGADGSSEVLAASSPFAPECLSVSIMDKISTRYTERERTLPAVARTIAATMNPRRGNYMVFAPSFEYLGALADSFRRSYPKIKVIEQKREMSQKERAAFLAEFENTRDEYLVGFAVMGGIYSEGIDLVGDRLIGAVVVGIGIPSLSYEREAMAEYYEERYEEGKQYAYVYPGMNRVFQAAGRVIRHELDRGVIVLIDDRFDDPIYRKAIPALWPGTEYIGDPKELNARIKEFWQGVDEENERK
jgi:Rad3-related DNA helicase